jgi:hypothetical protein
MQPVSSAKETSFIQYLWERIRFWTQSGTVAAHLLDWCNRASYLRIVAEQFTIPELLNAPLFLRRTRLEPAALPPSILDLSGIAVGGDAHAWHRISVPQMHEQAPGRGLQTSVPVHSHRERFGQGFFVQRTHGAIFSIHTPFAPKMPLFARVSHYPRKKQLRRRVIRCAH